jgi:hypothetical protein
MLVTFRSPATESITMFGDVAKQLLKMMGASGRIPGALRGEDVAAALGQLEQEADRLKALNDARTPARPAVNEDSPADGDDDDNHEPPVEIAVRAVPLLSLLKRAAAAKADVVWE